MGEAVGYPYIDVALPVPLHKTFTYSVPEEFRPLIRPGMRVLVPFGKQSHTGVIVGTLQSSAVPGIRPIHDLLDRTPTYSEDLLRLTKWISEYYLSPWGEVLRAAAPHGLSIESTSTVQLNTGQSENAPEVDRLGKNQQKILGILRRDGTRSLTSLKKESKIRAAISVVRSLEQHGYVTVSDSFKRPKARVQTVAYVRLTEQTSRMLSAEGGDALPKRTRTTLARLLPSLGMGGEWKLLSDLSVESGVAAQTISRQAMGGYLEKELREVIRDPFSGPVEPARSLSLTQHQEAALAGVRTSVAAEEFKVFLLHGITGSGKTQVYIEALRTVREKGKTAIVLVPEISLTPQTVRRFRSHFGDDVVVMHSQLSSGERYDAWRRVHDGRGTVVIGPRSAIFAPVENLGLVVVDEEHESSYKQYEPTPRYHARDAAVVRARQNDAVVILGSATPSVESYWNATNGKYSLLGLPERIDDAQLPEVRLVDMIAERKRQFERIRDDVREKGGAFPKRLPPMSISDELRNEIEKRLEKKEGVILLHNRRGFAHVVECPECGYAESCKNCEVTMTYHTKTRDLHCHYCGARRAVAKTCPSCLKGELTHTSFGTQQVQEELDALFPAARVLRMDRDTTRRKGAFDKLLTAFEHGSADILLGTQMVAKGLDFARVTLVGVISAETQLYLPDFRATERTFQLLTQVAGRAGRGHLIGEVVIQTVNPRHATLLHAVKHDFGAFYDEELTIRKEVHYPPYVRIALVECSGKDEGAVERRAAEIAQKLNSAKMSESIRVLGPAEPAIPKLRNQYRRHILLKSDRLKDPSALALRSALEPLLMEKRRTTERGNEVKLTIDVDPQSFL